MTLTTVEINKAIRVASNVNRMLTKSVRKSGIERRELVKAENASDTYFTSSLNSPSCIRNWPDIGRMPWIRLVVARPPDPPL